MANLTEATSISEWINMSHEEIDFQISASFPEGHQLNDKTFIMVAMGIEFASSMQQNTAYVVKDKGTMAFVGCF